MNREAKQVENQQSTSLVFGNYSIRVLTPQYAEPVLQLLSREFQNQQPISNAYYRAFPLQNKEERVQGWAKFFKLYESHYLTNGLSVGAFDIANNDELVGVSVVMDRNYQHDEVEELYTKDVNFISVFFEVERQLKVRMEEKYRPILNQGKDGMVLQFYSAAIKKEHMGKQLNYKMGRLIQKMAALKNYPYLFSFASNVKAGITLQKNLFQKISTLDLKEFEINGVKYFEKIEEDNRYASFYLLPTNFERAAST